METAVDRSNAPILTWNAQPGRGTFVIYHVVALDDWLAVPDRPYAPASLSDEGFVHCSPDEAVTLAVVNGFYRDTPGPLMALLIDEHKLDVMIRWEAADPAPPPELCSRMSMGASLATSERE